MLKALPGVLRSLPIAPTAKIKHVNALEIISKLDPTGNNYTNFRWFHCSAVCSSYA